MKRTFAPRERARSPWARVLAFRVHALAEQVPSGLRSAILLGAWVALASLIASGGAVLVAALVTAGRSRSIVVTTTAVLGVFGSLAVSPTLARAVVVAAVGPFEADPARDVDAEPERYVDAEPERWQPDARPANASADCRTPCCD